MFDIEDKDTALQALAATISKVLEEIFECDVKFTVHAQLDNENHHNHDLAFGNMTKDEIIEAYQRISTILEGKNGVCVTSEHNETEH